MYFSALILFIFGAFVCTFLAPNWFWAGCACAARRRHCRHRSRSRNRLCPTNHIHTYIHNNNPAISSVAVEPEKGPVCLSLCPSVCLSPWRWFSTTFHCRLYVCPSSFFVLLPIVCSFLLFSAACSQVVLFPLCASLTKLWSNWNSNACFSFFHFISFFPVRKVGCPYLCVHR